MTITTVNKIDGFLSTDDAVLREAVYDIIYEVFAQGYQQFYVFSNFDGYVHALPLWVTLA